MNIRRLPLKLSLYIKKSVYPEDYKISSAVRDAIIIFNNLVTNSESELLMHPTREKFYVKSIKYDLFVTVDANDSELSIINHLYGYNVKISNRILKNVTKVFLAEVEKRRLAMETEYKNNIKHSLNTLARDIKKRTTKL